MIITKAACAVYLIILVEYNVYHCCYYILLNLCHNSWRTITFTRPFSSVHQLRSYIAHFSFTVYPLQFLRQAVANWEIFFRVRVMRHGDNVKPVKAL